MKKPRDSRGKESTTLLFVVISFVVVLVKFIIAGMTLPIIGHMQGMTALEFAGAVTLVMAPWLGREWTEKVNSRRWGQNAPENIGDCHGGSDGAGGDFHL